MPDIGLYLKNLSRVISWKLMYGKKLSIDLKQGFGRHAVLYMKGSSKAVISGGTISRDNLYIRVENAEFKLGKGCFFNTNSSITCLESIKIGEGCSFGNNIVIVDHDHDYKKQTGKLFVTSPVILGNNVWVGANTVILKGSCIGDNAVIAAGSVVSGKVPENTLFYQIRQNNTKSIT